MSTVQSEYRKAFGKLVAGKGKLTLYQAGFWIERMNKMAARMGYLTWEQVVEKLENEQKQL